MLTWKVGPFSVYLDDPVPKCNATEMQCPFHSLLGIKGYVGTSFGVVGVRILEDGDALNPGTILKQQLELFLRSFIVNIL